MTGFRMTWHIHDMVTEKYTDFYLTTNNILGSVISPGFGSVPIPDFWSQSHAYTFTLDTTKIREVLTDESTLVMDVETGNSDSSQWSLIQAYTYTYHPELKSWQDAELQCVNQGGHLASIHSDQSLAVVSNRRDPNCRSPCHTWLGGTAEPGGHWTWTDKSHWDYQTSLSQSKTRQKCVILSDGKMSSFRCKNYFSFNCQKTTPMNTNITSYTKDTLPSLILSNYLFNNDSKENMSLTMSGFKVSWRIIQANSNTSMNISALPKLDFKAVTEHLYKNRNNDLRKIVLMTSLSPVVYHNNKTLWERALEAKLHWSYTNQVYLPFFARRTVSQAATLIML